MSRVDSVFDAIRSAGGKGLMPFVCAGHPTLDELPAILEALDRAGASVIEIGIPFSDPIADGPVIAGAMHRALAAGVTPPKVFASVASARSRVDAALIAMVSVSIVHRTGIDAFIADADAAGFDGFIFPDAPLEEAAQYVEPAKTRGLTASLLVAPATPADRAASIARASTGFVYVLARAGITGEQGDLPDVRDRVLHLRQATDLPIACGFGIATPDQVRRVVVDGGADAAIVGSALVRRLDQAADAAGAAESYVGELVEGLS